MNDINLVFCEALAVFGNGTTVQSTDWISWKVAQDLAGGAAPVVEIRVTTSAAGGTSAQFQLCAVDEAGANPVVIATTRPYLVAELVAPSGTPAMGGTVVLLTLSPQKSLPASTLTHLRVQTVNVGNNSALSISAALKASAGTANPSKAYTSGW